MLGCCLRFPQPLRVQIHLLKWQKLARVFLQCDCAMYFPKNMKMRLQNGLSWCQTDWSLSVLAPLQLFPCHKDNIFYKFPEPDQSTLTPRGLREQKIL